MKKFLKKFMLLYDLLLLPGLLLAVLVMRLFRRLPLRKMRLSRSLLEAAGVFPILDSYQEPSFKRSDLWQDPAQDRKLPGVDMNENGQLELLKLFHFQSELNALPREKTNASASQQFYYHNAGFEAGDAEYLYCLIRHLQPRQLIEVGCGYSTLMAQTAIRANQAGEPGYVCRHMCIEPYVNYWNQGLEKLPVEIIRQKVETVAASQFQALGQGDILFIDSSHVIRPQGDVLREFLEILPSLAPGVYVHVHDIFTPKDYQALWHRDICFSNEQYLLEAFLTLNRDFKIMAALNFLAHHHPEKLAEKFPVFAEDRAFCQPGSFWLQKE